MGIFVFLVNFHILPSNIRSWEAKLLSSRAIDQLSTKTSLQRHRFFFFFFFFFFAENWSGHGPRIGPCSTALRMFALPCHSQQDKVLRFYLFMPEFFLTCHVIQFSNYQSLFIERVGMKRERERERERERVCVCVCV